MSKGVKIVKSNVKAVLESLSGDRLGRAVMAGAFVLESAVKISMSASSHSGRIYGGHQASAPGETPAVDTGVLVNSIASELAETSETSATANVGTGIEYGVYLEFGTSKMQPRPFMRPAIDNNKERIISTVRNYAKRSTENAVK